MTRRTLLARLRIDIKSILVISVLLRLAAALYLGEEVVPLPGTFDQVSYNALAQNVAAGKGFVFDHAWYPFTPANTPTAHWSFIYTLYLAAVYTLFGYHPVVARLIQAIIVGLLMPWLVYRLGKRNLGEKVGLVGAAAISLYIYLLYYSATLMTEPFYITTLLWSLDILQRISKSPRRARLWVELGLAWGIAVLLRQQALMLAPLLLAWLLWATWRRVPIAQLLLRAALSLTIVALFILPWTLRNYRVYQRFLPLNSNVGWALYAANHPQQGTRFEPLNLPPLPDGVEGMNEAEMNDLLMKEGLRFVWDEPGRFALQTLDRFRNYFRFWPLSTSSPIANVSRALSFGLYLPFMLYGLYLSARRVTPDLVLLYLYAAAYSAIHLLSWAMHRYRLPVDAVMMPFVGLALLDLAERFKNRRLARSLPAGSS